MCFPFSSAMDETTDIAVTPMENRTIYPESVLTTTQTYNTVNVPYLLLILLIVVIVILLVVFVVFAVYISKKHPTRWNDFGN